MLLQLREAPKLPATLLAGLSAVLLISYLSAVWLDNDYIAQMVSGFFTFSVLLLSGYIGFAGGRNLGLRPFPVFLNGALVSGAAFLLLLIGVSLVSVAMGNSLSLDAIMLMPVIIMAATGGTCGLLGWLISRLVKKKAPPPEGIAA